MSFSISPKSIARMLFYFVASTVILLNNNAGMVFALVSTATRTPTQTPTRTTTKTPSPTKTATFLPTPATKMTLTGNVSPEDIFQQMDFFGGGGGLMNGGVIFCNNQIKPTLSYWSDTILPGHTLRIMTCGWKKDESVLITRTSPSGQIETFSYTTELELTDPAGTQNKGYAVFYEYNLPFETPAGIYRFKFSAKSGSIEASVKILPLTQPYGRRQDQIKHEALYLFNFFPGETIQIATYDFTGKFLGMQTTQVNSRGQLSTILPNNIAFAFVMGKKSGFVNPNKEGYFAMAPACAGALPSRLTTDRFASVSVATGKAGLNLREKPGKWAKTLINLKIHDYFEIIEGPACLEAAYWWKVRTLQGVTGWVQEANQRFYLATAERIQFPNQFCSAQSRLRVGDQGRVAMTDGSKMRIRSAPGLSQKILFEVQEGTTFTIKDGPKCTDEITWWKVHTSTGKEGWMAEHSRTESLIYWLEPLP